MSFAGQNGLNFNESRQQRKSMHNYNQLNMASSKSIRYTQSTISKEKSLASLSPKARNDIEQDMRVSESQSKIVFRDFAVPVHHGKGKVNLKSLIKTQPPGSRVESTLSSGVPPVDIITNHIQTTLKQVDEKNASKQEKIRQLQQEVAEKNGNVGHKKRTSLEKEEIWQMPTGVRNKYFHDQFFQKQNSKTNNRPAPTETIDQALKIPNFVKTGSFEGLALKARRL